MLYTRPESFGIAFTASDSLLDQMEKQVCVEQATSWMETAVRYCAITLATVIAMLIGNPTGSFIKPSNTPCLVDASCQTEDEELVELAWDWQLCDFDKCLADDDDQSCTTESTDLLSDAETEEYEQIGSDSDVDDYKLAADELLKTAFDGAESSCSSDCEAQADLLMRLTAVVCTEDNDTSAIYLEDYLCTCGECPQYKIIAHDVAVANGCWHNEQQRESITRLLQAFSTYNELVGYRAGMIYAARECLQMWFGDEDKAFKSFTALFDKVRGL